ncbi:peptidylprolyl isomerase [Oligoflexaceae bacterium]|nr:peptidylprolyl isomerase [Oligoflexaceae bacterium]
MTSLILKSLVLVVILAPYAILGTLFWSDIKEEKNIISVNQSDVRAFRKVSGEENEEEKAKSYYREEQNILANYLRTEILYREALDFGLDKDDLAIKHRLASKMYVYFLEIARNKLKLTDKDLLLYFKNHKQDYYVKPTYNFAHVFYNLQDRDRSLTKSVAREKLRELTSENVSMDAARYHGEKYDGQSVFRNITAEKINEEFGGDFSDRIANLRPSLKRWYGPFRSQKGLHIIKITGKTSGHYSKFELVKNEVKRDTTRWLLRKEVDKQLLDMQRSYKIQLDKSLPSALTSQLEGVKPQRKKQKDDRS